MKLIDVIGVIPEGQGFNVEVYKKSNKEDMIYAYLVRPYNKQDRDDLAYELDKEVTEIITYASVAKNPLDYEEKGWLIVAVCDKRY